MAPPGRLLGHTCSSRHRLSNKIQNAVLVGQQRPTWGAQRVEYVEPSKKYAGADRIPHPDHAVGYFLTCTVRAETAFCPTTEARVTH